MKYEITLVKSLICSRPNQRKTAQALGLKKIGSVVVKDDNEAIRGMIKTINHLIKVVEI